jgi:hypothetical protein
MRLVARRPNALVLSSTQFYPGRNKFMKCQIVKYVLLSVLAIAPLGCEPRPVVVDPDDGDSTTVVDTDDDVDAVTVPQPDTDVDVDITPDTSGAGSNTNQGSSQNANQ